VSYGYRRSCYISGAEWAVDYWYAYWHLYCIGERPQEQLVIPPSLAVHRLTYLPPTQGEDHLVTLDLFGGYRAVRG